MDEEQQENSNDVEVVAQETEAKQFGWVPKEDFKGDETEWRDASTFLKRGKEINGFLRKDLEKIKASHAREIAELRDTMKEFTAYHKETEARAYKFALEDLKKEKIAAIEQGDGERVVAIETQMDKVKEAQAIPTVKETPPRKEQNDREYTEWLVENQWYISDPKLGKIAEGMGSLLHTQHPELVGKEFLDEITRQVKEALPERFENPNRRNNQVGNSSDGRSPGGTKKKESYENLPADAKAACDKFVKQKLLTKEQFVADYDWG